jgi:hypothetical protein
MAELDQNSADCHVFTFKEGLLSSVAHDLKLRVGRWSLRVDKREGGGFALDASFDSSSLSVEAVMRDGRPQTGVLGPRDTDKIAKTIREEVLSSARHPTITWKGTATQGGPESARLDGELTLCGRTKVVSSNARSEGGETGAWIVEVPIHQPDFGIKPYSAMLGALKIKPDIRVVIRIPRVRLAELVASP